MTATLDDLIARLEAASEGNRELDARIWEGVPTFSIPRYTTSLDAALTLVPAGKEWDVGFYYEARAYFEACIRKPAALENDVVVEAATAPLALCIAALRARAIDDAERSTTGAADEPD